MKQTEARRFPKVRYAIYGVFLALPLLYFQGLPFLYYLLYSPAEGDVVFQSLSRSSDLVRAIEGVSNSPLSHCGVIVKKGEQWYVNEAFRPVSNTPLFDWIERGRGSQIHVYRLKDEYKKDIPAFVHALSSYQKLPYDSRYQMCDSHIYCSELVYKAFRDATSQEMGEMVSLGSMNWKPYTKTIEKYEKGPVPLDRLMITPANLSKAKQLQHYQTYGFRLDFFN